MWYIYETRAVAKALDRLPIDVVERYEFWKSVVIYSGDVGLRNFKGFHDHALKGQWQGFRSSRLNYHYRVIYQVQKTQISIHVLEISNHDYRKKI